MFYAFVASLNIAECNCNTMCKIVVAALPQSFGKSVTWLLEKFFQVMLHFLNETFVVNQMLWSVVLWNDYLQRITFPLNPTMYIIMFKLSKITQYHATCIWYPWVSLYFDSESLLMHELSNNIIIIVSSFSLVSTCWL